MKFKKLMEALPGHKEVPFNPVAIKNLLDLIKKGGKPLDPEQIELEKKVNVALGVKPTQTAQSIVNPGKTMSFVGMENKLKREAKKKDGDFGPVKDVEKIEAEESPWHKAELEEPKEWSKVLKLKEFFDLENGGSIDDPYMGVSKLKKLTIQTDDNDSDEDESPALDGEASKDALAQDHHYEKHRFDISDAQLESKKKIHEIKVGEIIVSAPNMKADVSISPAYEWAKNPENAGNTIKNILDPDIFNISNKSAFIVNTRNYPPTAQEKAMVLKIFKTLIDLKLLEQAEAKPSKDEVAKGIFAVVLNRALKLPQLAQVLKSKGLEVMNDYEWQALADKGEEKYKSKLSKDFDSHIPADLAKAMANQNDDDETEKDDQDDGGFPAIAKAEKEIAYARKHKLAPFYGDNEREDDE